jgi:hypothetical protein
MGPWKGFCNLPGFTWRVKAKVDFGGNAAADVSGEKPAAIVWTSDGSPCGRVSREDAKARRKRKKDVFREFPGQSSTVTQGVLWP